MVNRIKEIMSFYEISPSKFADLLDVPRSTISHIISERNKPSLEFIQKVLDKFPEIETNWLIKGEGEITGREKNLFSGLHTSLKKELHDVKAIPLQKEEAIEDLPAENSVKRDNARADHKYENVNEEKVSVQAPLQSGNQNYIHEKSNNSVRKKITRIITFYADDTFDVYFPSEKTTS
jgi:transcriptional regulator with XRE-family HTH domain